MKHIFLSEFVLLCRVVFCLSALRSQTVVLALLRLKRPGRFIVMLYKEKQQAERILISKLHNI